MPTSKGQRRKRKVFLARRRKEYMAAVKAERAERRQQAKA